MKQKVGFCNKKLWKNYGASVATFTTIVGAAFMFVDLPCCWKLVAGAAYLAILGLIYLYQLYSANKLQEKKLTINDTDVSIVYGDIFTRDGIKVIAFNEYFDTIVDDRIISATSLNGIFVKQKPDRAEKINQAVLADVRLPEKIVEKNCTRKLGGKTTKYKLGSVCPFEDYFLLAFAHVDDDNAAYLTIEDYIGCLMNMWHEIDTLYAGKPINITLLGSGITRFKNGNVTQQDLLKHLVWTFEASKSQLNNGSSLTIVLDKKISDKINLYDIGKE